MPEQGDIKDDVSRVALSVVVCTWNRAEMLRNTLHSIEASASNSMAEVEFIVVDNGSTDATATVVATFGDLGIRYLFEPKPGLSNARNAGVRASQGRWVLFLDDDVEVAPDLFARYIRNIHLSPEASFWGGPIRPAFEGPERSWTASVMTAHPWIYSCLDLGSPSRPFANGQLPFGANFCVRRELLAEIPFSPNLGYQHGVLNPGEETAVLAHIVDRGGTGRWLSDCWVDHKLPAERNSLAYLLRRAVSQGQTEGFLLRTAAKSRNWVFPELCGQIAKLAVDVLFKPKEAVSTLIRLATLLGILQGGGRLRR